MLCFQLRVLRIQRTEECTVQTKRIKLELEEIDNEISKKDDSCLVVANSSELNQLSDVAVRNKSSSKGEHSDGSFLLIEDDDILFSYESGVFDASAEWFSLLTEHLVILSLLQLLPLNDVNHMLNEAEAENQNAFGIEIETLNRLTLERMAQKGFGFYREQVILFLNNFIQN